MPDTNTEPRPASARDLLFLRTPGLWQHWPFLPLVRRRPGCELECGVLYDCWSVARRGGFSATVFLCNIFYLPRTEDAFLALPREVYDSADEIAQAGWRVD